MPMFQRILVANRGEIALRIIRACKELGIEVVAVYSQADRDAPYLALADRTICIGKAPSARELSQNPPDDRRRRGRRRPGDPSRLRISERESPLRRGLPQQQLRVHRASSRGDPPNGPEDRGQGRRRGGEGRLRARLGWPGRHRCRGDPPGLDDRLPVLIKAAAGGGGKGMRVVRDEASFTSSSRAARTEAEAAFKNPSVYLEKFIDKPRHVEIQILADNFGNVVHCWDRDCSVQRRHQKLIEESPASTVPPKVRAKLGEAAVRLAKTVGYVNAGTCEFLVDADNRFYFIEVNARLQVEHPVTEMVNGHRPGEAADPDRRGQRLPFRQNDIAMHGHAIEVRINSEDPDHDFRPSPGKITALRIPGGRGVRWDSHIQIGYSVPTNYDSLIGKLIVQGRDRLEAIAIMRRALDELVIEGIQTTIPLHRRIIRDPHFIEARVDTTWMEREFMPARAAAATAAS